MKVSGATAAYGGRANYTEGVHHLKHGDLVSRANCGEAMCDHQRCSAGSKALECALHETLTRSVQRARSLVQQQQARVLQEGAGDRYALLLPAAELHANVTHLEITLCG